MFNKYVCPLCGGGLFFWQEFVFQKNQNIDKQTGKLEKVRKSSASKIDTNGIECHKCGATWSGSKCDYDEPLVDEIFEKINKNSKEDVRS